jgi:hypothetical protein
MQSLLLQEYPILFSCQILKAMWYVEEVRLHYHIIVITSDMQTDMLFSLICGTNTMNERTDVKNSSTPETKAILLNGQNPPNIYNLELK